MGIIWKTQCYRASAKLLCNVASKSQVLCCDARC